MSSSIETQKYRIPVCRLSRDDALELAKLVEEAARKSFDGQIVLRASDGSLLVPKPVYEIQGRKRDFTCDSLDLLGKGRWPADTERVVMTTPSFAPYFVSIKIDAENSGDNTVVVRGTDSIWVNGSMKIVEELFEPRKSLVGTIRRQSTLWLFSLLLAGILITYASQKILRFQPLAIWTDPALAFFALLFSCVGAAVVFNPIERGIHFLFPYVEFSWNQERGRRIAKWVVLGLISLFMTGFLYDLFRLVLA